MCTLLFTKGGRGVLLYIVAVNVAPKYIMI